MLFCSIWYRYKVGNLHLNAKFRFSYHHHHTLKSIFLICVLSCYSITMNISKLNSLLVWVRHWSILNMIAPFIFFFYLIYYYNVQCNDLWAYVFNAIQLKELWRNLRSRWWWRWCRRSKPSVSFRGSFQFAQSKERTIESWIVRKTAQLFSWFMRFLHVRSYILQCCIYAIAWW